MSMNRIIMCALFILVSLSAHSSTKFIESNFEEAREKAHREGKMLLLDFYAAWCAPCRFMENTTFKDAEVSAILNEKFVPLKIDIDDFDGYALKEHFGVKVLPTFLIFSSDGKVIERVEETLSPSRMKDILEKSLSTFRPVIRATNVSPKETNKSKIATAAEKMSSYKIQLGMFSSYESTLRFYNKLAGQIKDPIIILHDYKGGRIVYRVLVGNFENTNEAYFYLSDLKEKYGIDGHIYL